MPPYTPETDADDTAAESHDAERPPLLSLDPIDDPDVEGAHFEVDLRALPDGPPFPGGHYVEVLVDHVEGDPVLLVGDLGAARPRDAPNITQIDDDGLLQLPAVATSGEPADARQFRSLGLDPDVYDPDDRLVMAAFAMDDVLSLEPLGYEGGHEYSPSQPRPDVATDADAATDSAGADVDLAPEPIDAPELDADHDQFQYTRALRHAGERIEVTLPKELADDLGFAKGDPMAFIPRLVDGRVVFDVSRGNGTLRNETTLFREVDGTQTKLRIPREFAVACNLFQLVDDAETAAQRQVGIDRRDDNTVRLTPLRSPLVPTPLDEAAPVAGPIEKKLVRQAREDWYLLRLELNEEFAEGMGLSGGETFVTRFVEIDGDLAVSLDRAPDADPDAQTTRTVYMADVDVERGSYDIPRIGFSRPVAHALEFVTLDGRAPLEVSATENRILLQRAGAAAAENLDW